VDGNYGLCYPENVRLSDPVFRFSTKVFPTIVEHGESGILLCLFTGESPSSRSPASPTTFFLLDPLSDIGRAIFELDAIRLAAGKEINSILIDDRHVLQIKNQLFSRCLRGEELLELLDVLCLNSSTEREDDSTIR
jgi:hypothetical protein